MSRRDDLQIAIMNHIRDGIRSSVFKPGERLPTRKAFERRFRTTGVTVQRAFTRLQEAGFVRGNGRLGTFVADRPPSLFRYALVFPDVAATGARNLFWQILQQEAPSVGRRLGVEIDINFGLTSQIAASADHRRLCRDIAEGRLAGVCFATSPHLGRGTPLLEAPNLPRVAIMLPPPFPGVNVIVLESGEALARRALSFLRQRGRKRVAFITVPGMPGNLLELAQEANMFCADWWVQMGIQSEPKAAGRLAELLMRQPQKYRPDSLVILDDNLTESVCAGLLRAGVRIGGDIEVVSHCNFPAPTDLVVPIARLGFDARVVLHTALRILQEIRSGKKPPQMVRIPPLFESECQKNTDVATSSALAIA